ncbi:helix-turn-helix domain-containing protein [Shewanella sp. 202IG2-18]|uniref:helix-turn-helix domain-containing protein n=1 Tax=Parashewanella hymeniacidonis TaxID=2807618 RepID=UPI0019613742|nr:helix-turn-helix domain-containing protein [Parashewanella hymeniacidonis]MBM7070899.1 helix-turn-helix domain-containing protein [Parashewanella hymeniacidonis]
MSMMLMVKAMQLKVGSPIRKLVLLKLADQANDHGECWPSYQHIADHCETSKRSVMNHVKVLEESGLLRREYRKGEKGNSSNVYHLTLDNQKPSENNSLPLVNDIHHPSANGSLPSESPSLPPSESPSPRTSHSFEPVNEPVKEPKEIKRKTSKKSQKLDFSKWPSMPSKQVFDDWNAMRKDEHRVKSLSQTVVNRLAKELTQCANAGYSMDDVFGLGTLKGWRGLEYQWVVNYYANAQQPKHGFNQPNHVAPKGSQFAPPPGHKFHKGAAA